MQRTTNYDQLKGASLITGLPYTAQTTSQDSWEAQAPFPSTHRSAENVEYLAQGSTDNFLLRLRTKVTVTADGVPTATVEQVDADCTG
jgi:hypothetical protein